VVLVGILLGGCLAMRAAAVEVTRVIAFDAMHVFGRATPFDAFDVARAFRSDDISRRVNQDVLLLLAGADDHYVPLDQLWDLARTLTAARSVTCRVFTRADGAQAHCQVGNLPLAIDAMTGWLKMLRPV